MRNILYILLFPLLAHTQIVSLQLNAIKADEYKLCIGHLSERFDGTLEGGLELGKLEGFYSSLYGSYYEGNKLKLGMGMDWGVEWIKPYEPTFCVFLGIRWLFMPQLGLDIKSEYRYRWVNNSWRYGNYIGLIYYF